MKCQPIPDCADDFRRSPCGERGLKSASMSGFSSRALSLPVRGAWIEIIREAVPGSRKVTSLPVRGAWIEMLIEPVTPSIMLSLPVRGAWIEIQMPCRGRGCRTSLPVRGAWIEIAKKHKGICTTPRRSPCGERGLKCSVCPHISRRLMSLPVRGAWIEISFFVAVFGLSRSLPVRGAWIEIEGGSECGRSAAVAPRAGSVD